jgi:small subunit ribosomal protein S3
LAVEKKFVQDGFVKALIDEYLSKELNRAGYGGMVMNRTPMGTQITVHAEKPGMVIGKGGKQIRKITRDLDKKFHLDNPQIDVQDVGKAELNAQVMANRLASSLERGWYFRKAGQSTLRRVMDSGALGCEVIISGKLTGPRSRTEKFLDGYIKHSGKPAEEIVDHGYAVAVKKLGVIGCQVRIVPPGVIPPDEFEIVKAKASVEAPPEKRSDIEEILQGAEAPMGPKTDDTEKPAPKEDLAAGAGVVTDLDDTSGGLQEAEESDTEEIVEEQPRPDET